MEQADYLFTIAEIGAAFAGFAGLVTVVAQRLAPDHVVVDTHLLQSMLVLSLLSVAFSLVPYILAGFSASGAVPWRVASLAFFLAWLSYFAVTTRRIRRIRRIRAHPAETLYQGIPTWFNVAIHLALGASLLLVSLGFFNQLAAAIYAADLGVLLYFAAFLLFRLFTRLASS